MAFTYNPSVVSTVEGNCPLIKPYREASSQSFLTGQLVYLSGGYVTACASDGVVILGRAMKAATNVTSAWTTIPVEIFRPGDRIKMYASGATPAATLNEINYAITVASNICTIDLSDTGHDAFNMTDYEVDAAGAVTGWVFAQILPAVSQWATGA